MSDDIVRRVAGAEILHFPRAAAPAEVEPMPASATASAKMADVSVSRGSGGGGQPPAGGSSDSGDDGGADDIVAFLNRTYALVLVGQRALVISERDDAPPTEQIRMLSLDAFKALFANRGSTVPKRERQEDGTWIEATRYVKWAPMWLQAKARRTCDGVVFFPNPDGVAPPAGYLNLWRGYSVLPDTGPKAERLQKYKTYYDHLLTNICAGNRDHFDWIFHWLAQIVQRPRQRIGTAVVVRGGMGTGKTKLGEYIGALFASHYFLVDDPRYLVGQFNAHMATCLLLQVDEGFWAGDKAAEGRLKGLVTSSRQMIEMKGVDAIPLDNYVRLLFSSNEDWVVPAGMDERRFAVFDVAPHAAQNHQYFGEMDAEMKTGGLEALLADLLDVDLDAETAPKIRVIPKTEALLEQKIRSLDPISNWWFARLDNGSPTHRRASWPDEIPISTMFDDYVRSSEKIGVRRKSDETAFGMRMRKLVGDGLTKVRRFHEVDTADGTWERRRVWCFALPPLVDCRAAFEAALGGQRVSWNPMDSDQGADEGDASGESPV